MYMLQGFCEIRNFAKFLKISGISRNPWKGQGFREIPEISGISRNSWNDSVILRNPWKGQGFCEIPEMIQWFREIPEISGILRNSWNYSVNLRNHWLTIFWFNPWTDAIFLPLTRAWGAEGCDEAGWGEAESHPEADARVFRGLSHKTVRFHNVYISQNFAKSLNNFRNFAKSLKF